MHISSVTQEELDAYIASLPVEDEEISAEELAAVEEGLAAAERGEFATAEEIARIVGVEVNSSSATRVQAVAVPKA